MENYAAPGVKLNYDTNNGSSYAGLDRFGRVMDHRWQKGTTDRDHFTYGYDQASNRRYRENTVATAKDEFYTYDDANRLATFDRGTLTSPNKDGISGTPAKEEDWTTLDMTGNWGQWVIKNRRQHGPEPGPALTTARTRSRISPTSTWVDPLHDRAGNMTRLPKPSSPGHGAHLQMGRLEPAGRGERRHHGREPL